MSYPCFAQSQYSKVINPFEANVPFFYLLETNVNFNSFQANDPFPYPLKTSENVWFSDFFRGMQKDHWLK